MIIANPTHSLSFFSRIKKYCEHDEKLIVFKKWNSKGASLNYLMMNDKITRMK